MYTTLRQISDRVAEKLNLDPNEVYKVNKVYWAEVRNKMKNPTDIYLNIINIGTIKADKGYINNEINRLNKINKTIFQEERLNKLTLLSEIFKTLDNDVRHYKSSINSI